MSRHVALHQAGIGHNRSVAAHETRYLSVRILRLLVVPHARLFSFYRFKKGDAKDAVVHVTGARTGQQVLLPPLAEAPHSMGCLQPAWIGKGKSGNAIDPPPST